jgi:hypothetical protein
MEEVLTFTGAAVLPEVCEDCGDSAWSAWTCAPGDDHPHWTCLVCGAQYCLECPK